MPPLKKFSGFIVTMLVAAIISIVLSGNIMQQSYAQQSTNTLAGTPQSNTTQSNASQTTTNFETAREQYLAAWNNTTFHSRFDTFIQADSGTGYGVYVSHPPVFKPGDTIVLYAEPVGYGFKQVVDAQGNTLNQINLTAVITIASSNGTQLTSPLSIPLGSITSHNKTTEMYMTLKVNQTTPAPVGDYKITYNIKDGSTGKSFQLVKTVKVANFVTPG
jgi:hypothetical protein